MFKNLPNYFSNWLHHFMLPPAMSEWSDSASVSALAVVIIFNFSHSERYVVIAYGGFLRFPNDWSHWTSFLSLFATWWNVCSLFSIYFFSLGCLYFSIHMFSDCFHCSPHKERTSPSHELLILATVVFSSKIFFGPFLCLLFLCWACLRLCWALLLCHLFANMPVEAFLK